MDEEEQLTTEDMETLKQLGYGNYPQEEEKQNMFAFFKRVLSTKDNTKTGNLTNEEIGEVRLPVRTNKQIALYCKVMGMKGFANYFESESQILLGSSLSRDGFLDKLAVTQKKEMETKTRTSVPIKRGWFKPKKQEFV